MPVILVGQLICVVGTGLLTRLDMTTSTVEWTAFLVLTGTGLGMGINTPHTAIQAVMETETDVFLVHGVATFFSQLGGTIALPIGNAFISILLGNTSRNTPINDKCNFFYTDGLDAQIIVNAGPMAINQLASGSSTVLHIRLAYSKAIQHVVIFALAVVCASVPAAAGTHWLNIKNVAEKCNEVQGVQVVAGNVEHEDASQGFSLRVHYILSVFTLVIDVVLEENIRESTCLLHLRRTCGAKSTERSQLAAIDPLILNDLPDELLLIICRYVLSIPERLYLEAVDERGIRCPNLKDIAAGLLFTNRHLSCLAEPILYEENTIDISQQPRDVIHFLESLPQRNLERIRQIYLPRVNSGKSPVINTLSTILRQRMSLDSISIPSPGRLLTSRYMDYYLHARLHNSPHYGLLSIIYIML
ncbi:hypothetical protein K458DRAFT_465018 [Lentithecium fluviatile CBS 122367]|uniref:Uncharacterized protein n=1 Tax=Lentithecium fluviatile CBS 122367 TaxID=1168545 RepID=A0A6G1JD76_9PLEO|nr:hypothetical protein K458DRAFT_465018 [Lentithecium fluviatile CBS 122367]